MDAKTIRHVALIDDGDTAETRLSVTNFLIEATSNEWHTLWSRWCKQSIECREPLITKWEQLGGWGVQVGVLHGRPIVVSLNWDRLDGFLVCQWEPTSQLVDYQMIEEWLEKHYTTTTHDGRRAACDAINFHQLALEFDKAGKAVVR